MCSFKASATSLTFAVLVLYAWLLPRSVDARWIRIHKPNLDIVLLFDQSKTMIRLRKNVIWKDMNEWIKLYYAKGKDETRFAVMGCGGLTEDSDTIPSLKWNDLVSVKVEDKVEAIIKKVLEAQENINVTFRDNVAGCTRSTIEKVFTKESGDRIDAPNIGFYISDCNLRTRTPKDVISHKNYTAIFQQRSLLMFLCVKDGDYNGKYITEWLNGNIKMILNYTDKSSFFARLDKVLENYSMPFEVWDCVWSQHWTPCMMDGKGKCVKTQHTNILNHSGPEDAVGIYVNACSFVIPTKNDTVKCDKTACLTGISSTTVKLISSTVRERTTASDHTETATTTVQGRATTAIGNTMPSNAKEGTTKTGEERRPDESDGSTAMTIGVIAGVVLLLSLIIIIIVIVVLCRKKKTKTVPKKVAKQGRRGVDLKKDEKHKGIAADIREGDMSTVRGRSPTSKVGGRSPISNVDRKTPSSKIVAKSPHSKGQTKHRKSVASKKTVKK